MREQNNSKDDDQNITFDNIYHDIKQESVDMLLHKKSDTCYNTIYRWILSIKLLISCFRNRQ